MLLRDEEAGIELAVSADTGGELSSLRVRRGEDWVQLLDRAAAPGPPPPGRWRGRAPWLFPAVGRSRVDGREGFWRHRGTVRPMPIHGGLLERPWKPLVSKGELACRFDAEPGTLEGYPFAFALTARYAPQGLGVRSRLEVRAAASNAEPMPFSVGNHLTLRLPFGSSSTAQACVVRSPARERWELTREGFLSGERSRFDPAGATLGQDPRLLDSVLGSFPGEASVEVVDPASFGVRVAHRVARGEVNDPGRAFFVLWGDPRRRFFCPEPWLGGPDSLNERRGIVELEPSGVFEWEWRLEVLADSR